MGLCMDRLPGRLFDGRRARPAAFDDVQNRDVEDRRENEAEERDAEHSGEHRDPHRMPHLGAGAAREHQRQHAHDEGEGRHEDGPGHQCGTPQAL